MRIFNRKFDNADFQPQRIRHAKFHPHTNKGELQIRDNIDETRFLILRWGAGVPSSNMRDQIYC